MGSNGTIDHIGQLTPDPRNARRHTPRNVGLIESALGEVGFARSIVIDEDGTILAGNATVEAAARVGMDRVKVIDATGEDIIAVRRTGLTPEQKTRLALFDNRAAEMAEWDPSVLESLADEVDLSGLWRDDELDALLARVEPFDPRAEWTGMPEFEQDDLGPVKQLTVNFASTEDLTAFANLIGQKIVITTKSVWYPAQRIESYVEKVYVGADDGT